MPKHTFDSKDAIISGAIERITFYSDENNFTVIKLRVDGLALPVTVTGIASDVKVGAYIECTGEWFMDKKFGKQFKAFLISPTQPKITAGIRKFLSSGLIKAIGTQFAEKLIQRFGDDTLNVLTEEPRKLLEIPGISEERLSEITTSWLEHKDVSATIVFLTMHGVGVTHALKIANFYGIDAKTLINRDPYRLASDIPGFGFKKADELASRLGFARNSLARAQAGILYTMQELVAKGNCACEIQNLIYQANNLLEIDAEILEEAIGKEIKKKTIISENIENNTLIYLSSLWDAEEKVARNLLRLSQNSQRMRHAGAISAKQLQQICLKLGLSESQSRAVEISIEEKVLVITGGPGVGKTTLTTALIELAKKMEQTNIILCAPTGRAAKRLSESTKHDAKTIHRLLEFEHQYGGFKRNHENQLEVETLIIDEASMIDVKLMGHLLEAVPTSANVIFVGDIDQLPSIGPGSVLSDIIKSQVIAVIHLTEVFRQSKNSRIITNAHRINKGEMPNSKLKEDGLSDFYFIKTSTDEKTLEFIVEIVTKRIPLRFKLDPFQHIQVLSPMKIGNLGTRHLNMELQNNLNPPDAFSISNDGLTFSCGDKVIQLVNDYEKGIFNGDVGSILSIDQEKAELTIVFDEKQIQYAFAELQNISLAYATSIHKSQGSEYPAVVIPICAQHAYMLERNLLYTAITRGKQVVVLVGQVEPFIAAVKKTHSNRRVSGLAHKLSQY